MDSVRGACRTFWPGRAAWRGECPRRRAARREEIQVSSVPVSCTGFPSDAAVCVRNVAHVVGPRSLTGRLCGGAAERPKAGRPLAAVLARRKRLGLQAGLVPIAKAHAAGTPTIGHGLPFGRAGPRPLR